ncbi:hypothetical protein JMX17_01210 [Cutibacterium avidum]|nr:hypothetical protein [Cutibacterium avidum]MDU5414734.1 hypothetical protein [Cutibacterium avidum]MDU5420129.1 hypothetical protein [Cutibacterium avidum]QQY13997.1 hypothetical protein JMX17_01210 [Cutibacterium avidum]
MRVHVTTGRSLRRFTRATGLGAACWYDAEGASHEGSTSAERYGSDSGLDVLSACPESGCEGAHEDSSCFGSSAHEPHSSGREKLSGRWLFWLIGVLQVLR